MGGVNYPTIIWGFVDKFVGEVTSFTFFLSSVFTFQLNSKDVLTLSDLLDKPWSQVPSLLPGMCLSHIGYI